MKNETTVTCDFNEYNTISVEEPQDSELLCLEINGQFLSSLLITLTKKDVKKLIKALNKFASKEGQ